ncbi:FAD-dependent monooxygenase [Nocardia sp. BMG51109]|uniref:FAD-dependent monooxygenase n=1 Tax=Nocardia sp. BMG51109 TaxID=1056816 RepID=UPI0004669308|nr:FAD-dependent monooxygenase [Nocardia sp. BMG51109]
MDEFDVVIVGAGPVGLMLAGELRLNDVNVLVIERLSEMDRTLKAGGVNASTMQMFDRRGLLPAMSEYHHRNIAKILPAFAHTAPSPGDGRPPFAGHFAGIFIHRADVDATDPAFADLGAAGGFMMVDQQGVETVLGRWVAELGVPVRRGVQARGFAADADGVTVDLGDESVRAAWLVGCDGGRSPVRKQAGFEFPGVDPEITGHQAVVTISGTESLRPGWNSTDTGIYAYNPHSEGTSRILTVETDGPPADRSAPITAAELERSMRRVSGAPVRIGEVHSATRFTDNTRQATRYRSGRVLLAGDAAHVHSPFGGQGLNLGIGDAVNLGWKLAAVLGGRASEDLLETYTAERHPIGAWVLHWTRAQVAVMRKDPHSKAMREVLSELLATKDGATYVAKRLTGVLNRYDLGDGHPLVGGVVPDLDLADGSRLAQYFTAGGAVLLDPADSAELRAAAEPWSDHIRIVTAKPLVAQNLTGLFSRPDGYVAWASDGGPDGLAAALRRWLGDPTRSGTA